MPATATVISVNRQQIIEIETALAADISFMLAEVTRTSGSESTEELLRLMEQLAALRVVGQQLSLQVRVRNYDFGFNDDYCYDGRLAEVEELANLTEHLLRPALELKGSKGLLDQTTQMLARLDQTINKVNEQTVTIDYSALELDENDLPPALLALVGGASDDESDGETEEEAQEEVAPQPIPPPARKTLRGKLEDKTPVATVKPEDEIEAHSNKRNRKKASKKAGKPLKGTSRKKRSRS